MRERAWAWAGVLEEGAPEQTQPPRGVVDRMRARALVCMLPPHAPPPPHRHPRIDAPSRRSKRSRDLPISSLLVAPDPVESRRRPSSDRFLSLLRCPSQALTHMFSSFPLSHRPTLPVRCTTHVRILL